MICILQPWVNARGYGSKKRNASRIARERIRVLFQGRNRAIAGAEDQIIEPYVNEINAYLHHLQGVRRPNPAYLAAIQNDITENMRSQVIDWLVGFADDFNLSSESVCLSVSYLDRFLSGNAIQRGSFQRFGAASLLIAAKYQEVGPTPSTAVYCDMTYNSFTVQELVETETQVLRSLDYQLGDPTSMTYLRNFTVVAHSQREFQTSKLTLEALSQYLAELSLVEYSLLQFWPNLIAAAVTFLARFCVKPRLQPWSLALQHTTGFRPGELRNCAVILQDLMSGRRGGNLDLLRRKFRKRKFRHVAKFIPVEVPDHYFEDLVVEDHGGQDTCC